VARLRCNPYPVLLIQQMTRQKPSVGFSIAATHIEPWDIMDPPNRGGSISLLNMTTEFFWDIMNLRRVLLHIILDCMYLQYLHRCVAQSCSKRNLWYTIVLSVSKWYILYSTNVLTINKQNMINFLLPIIHFHHNF